MTARLYKFPPIGGDDDGHYGKRHPQVLYPDQLGERVDLRLNLIDELAAENAQRDALAHYRKQVRKAVLQRYVRAFCLAVAVGSVVYFGLQILRVFL